MLHLGLFKQFEGEVDTLLLSGEPGDITDLSNRLGEFAASHSLDWSVHAIARLSAHNPVELFAASKALHHATGFVWLCSPESLPSIQGELQALASSGSGHQYFELLGSSVPLVVSVGEYRESWWSGGA